MSQTLTSITTAAGGVLAGFAAGGAWALRLRTLLRRSRINNIAQQTELAGMWQTNRRLREERDTYRYQALHDEITGMPNRRAAIAFMTAALHADEPLGVLMVDLTRFKPINDNLGHRAGNTLLTQVGERLMRLTGRYVDAARLSGDEFSMLVRGDADTTAAVAATAWRAISDSPFIIAGQHLAITASIGYATSAGDGTDPESLLNRADVAMYWAKADGGGVFGYDESLGTTPGGGRPRDWLPNQHRWHQG